MRKSTLLMGLLLAGCATAAAEYVVPVASTDEAPKYYKVVSNRALTLSYRAENGDANTAVEAGQGTFGQRPYVGLFGLNKAAISNDETYVPDASLLWRFKAVEGNTTGKLDDGVLWVNLYSPDMVLFAAGGEGDLAYLTAKGTTLYAHNLNYVNENAGTEVFWNNSYCISTNANPSVSACFDVKNYVNTNSQSYADGPYVFMAANWNPFADFGVDPDNGTYSSDPNANNGSVFYFEEATAQEVADAQEALVELEKEILEKEGPLEIAAAKEGAVNGLIAYSNVPALWNATDVANVLAEVEALPLSMDGLENLKQLRTSIQEYNEKVAELTAALVQKLNGKIVTFQNVQRGYMGEEGVPAFLAAGEETNYDPETGDPVVTSSLVMLNDAEDEAAQWILNVTEGGVYLFNKGLEVYPSAENPAVNQSWLTVADKAEAAVMNIVGVPTDTLAYDVTNYVAIENVGEREQGYPYLHAAGSGTNYNVVGWLRDNFDTASNWIVSCIGDNSSINSVSTENTEKAANTIYDLSGRRVATISRPGLYIVNGKKVLVNK